MDYFDSLALWVGRTILVIGGCLTSSFIAFAMIDAILNRLRRSKPVAGGSHTIHISGTIDPNLCWICGEDHKGKHACPTIRTGG